MCSAVFGVAFCGHVYRLWWNKYCRGPKNSSSSGDSAVCAVKCSSIRTDSTVIFGSSVGPVVMLNIFFYQWWWQCVCREVLLKVGFVKTYQSKMHQGCLHCQDSPQSSSPNTHRLKLERIFTIIRGMIRNVLHDQMCSNRRHLTR